jgi:hypothetical protein
MRSTIVRALTLMLAVSAAACNGSGVGNSISGALGSSGEARLVDASPATSQTLSMTADNATIDSNVSAGAPVAPYAKVGAGSINFAVPPTSVTDTSSVAASTNYSLMLEGEPGLGDYQLFGFADNNALPHSNTVRFKINNAAPDIATAVDVYVWLSTDTIPGTPTVADMSLNQDTGSVPNNPGDSYIPRSTDNTTVLPTGTYDIAVVQTGAVPNGTSDLFDGSVALTVGNSYSLTLQDGPGGATNSVGVIAAIDEPLQTANQANMFAVGRHSLR